MQSHEQLEHDSSQPIVIPGQEVPQSNFVPESFQTAQSLEYPFSSSVNSTSSQAMNNSYTHSQFMNSNMRTAFNTSPTANFSPRANPPSHTHRASFTQENSFVASSRPSLLTTKLASQSSVTQLPPIMHQQQDHLTGSSSFRSSSFRGSFQGPISTASPQYSSSMQASLPQRSANITIQQPSTSAHFNQSGMANSFTPYHNTPSAVSSSYSSAPNSVPSHFNQASSFNFQQPSRTQPTTIVATENSRNADFARPQSLSSRSSVQTTRGFDTPSSSQRIPQQHQPQQHQPQQQHQNMDHISGTPQSLPYGEPLISSTISDSSFSEHLDIVNHPVDDLLLMLSALLQKIIEANDNLHPHHYHHASQLHPTNKYTGNVLAFHGRNVPAISIHAYLTRILKYCPVTNEVFLTLLVYFDRIAKRANAGDLEENSEGKEDQLFVMDSYNIHRLIIAGITVASKFFSDIFYKNSRYARVGGLPLDELNHLELQFLLLTDFRLLIPIEELQRYADLLLKFWNREQTKKEQSQGEQQQLA